MTNQQMNDEAIPRSQEDNMDIIKILVDQMKELTRRIETLESLPQDTIEIKEDAGDYAAGSSWNGRRVLNTNDNTYKIFAEGSWRSIVAY